MPVLKAQQGLLALMAPLARKAFKVSRVTPAMSDRKVRLAPMALKDHKVCKGHRETWVPQEQPVMPVPKDPKVRRATRAQWVPPAPKVIRVCLVRPAPMALSVRKDRRVTLVRQDPKVMRAQSGRREPMVR
jgi:hypothetical protein